MDQAAAADNVNWVTPSGTPWTTDGRRETAPTTFVNDDYYAAYTQDQASWTDPQAQQPQQRSNQPNGGGAAYPHGTMPNPAYPYIGQYYQQPSQSNGQSSSQPTPHHSPPQYPQTTQGQVFQPPQSSGFNGQPGAPTVHALQSSKLIMSQVPLCLRGPSNTTTPGCHIRTTSLPRRLRGPPSRTNNNRARRSDSCRALQRTITSL